MVNFKLHLKNIWMSWIYRGFINIYFGKKIYGNNSGFIANYIGNLVLQKNRIKTLNGNKFNNYSKEAESIRKNGFLVLTNECKYEALVLHENFKKKVASFPTPRSLRLEFTSINNENFYRTFPEVEKILTSKIIGIVKSYYHSNFRILNTHIYRTYSSNSSKQLDQEIYGSTEYWHNDGSTTDGLKIFVLLTDVDLNSGPMFLIDKDESKQIISEGFSKYKNGMAGGAIDNNCNLIKFTGKAGDILIADPNLCLHRASEPQSDKVRDMLVFYLTCTTENQVKIKGIEEQYYGFRRLFAA